METQMNNNELVSFGYSEKELRTTLDENNNPWFVAKDVCKILNISWTSRTLKNFPEEWKGVINFITPSKSHDSRGGGKQELVIINQPALFKLAFRSNKPEADKFTNWVAGEVLPGLLNNGYFQINSAIKQNQLKSLEIDRKVKHIASFSWAMYKEIEEEPELLRKEALAGYLMVEIYNKLQMLEVFLNNNLQLRG